MASIQLSGSVGSGGSFAILGFANVEIVGNANLTLSLTQYSNLFIQVTSDGASSGIKNVVVPLNEGTAFIVENKTSEGFAIQVIGPSGTGVTVASGASALVYTDGTNYISLGSTTVVASVGVTGPIENTGTSTAPVIAITPGAVDGQVLTTTTAGAATAFAFVFGTWTADVLPAASPFTPTVDQVMVAVNTTTGAVTVVTPVSPADGQVLCIKPTAASATPITVNANATPAGVTVENPSNGGNFVAAGAEIPGQGSGAWFKYRTLDKKWIAMPGGF